MTHDKHVTYISYLKVDELLELQQPLSDGPEHDELLFITIHQVQELWLKLCVHEIDGAIALAQAWRHRLQVGAIPDPAISWHPMMDAIGRRFRGNDGAERGHDRL